MIYNEVIIVIFGNNRIIFNINIYIIFGIFIYNIL